VLVFSNYTFLVQPVTREAEVQAEDEQAFLTRQHQVLQGVATVPGTRQELPVRSPAGTHKTGERRSVRFCDVLLLFAQSELKPT